MQYKHTKHTRTDTVRLQATKITWAAFTFAQMGPQEKRPSRSRPTEPVMARVLDHESQIVGCSKGDCRLNVQLRAAARQIHNDDDLW